MTYRKEFYLVTVVNVSVVANSTPGVVSPLSGWGHWSLLESRSGHMCSTAGHLPRRAAPGPMHPIVFT
uniref:Uncharacterized protein n=1 Tax=Ascaris lumbricoides TaxID=6252 RepID=A0A0M3IWF6_ASCLU